MDEEKKAIRDDNRDAIVEMARLYVQVAKRINSGHPLDNPNEEEEAYERLEAVVNAYDEWGDS
jgi:hypothetical protein